MTENEKSGFRRRYRDACAAAHALDLIGDRWALLVVRELMTGPKRFSDLRAGLPGISANILTQRLAELETVGLLIRAELPPPAATKVYELTQWGYEAEPILKVLGNWAARSPLHDPTMPFSAASCILSMRTMFSPEKAEEDQFKIGIRLGRETFVAYVNQGHFTCDPASVDGISTVITCAPESLAAAIYGGVPLDTLIADGVISITGDRAVFERYTTLFPLPEKAATPASVAADILNEQAS